MTTTSTEAIRGMRFAIRLSVIHLGRDATAPTSALQGSSPAMAALRREISRCADSAARVLLVGESGSGKELVASEIHRRSRRGAFPLVTVNSAGLAETLLESELFGHVKGSFTGAFRDKPGKFELAHRGTLFLDEVGEMTPRLQGLLLRVLETGEIQKVGADRRGSLVDVRIIAATHRDLPAMVASGQFREDLYYRLHVLEVRVPPLREREGDVRVLTDAFVESWMREHHTSVRFTAEAHGALARYLWPGNVRQLHNVLESVLARREGNEVGIGDLPPDIRGSWLPSAAVPVERRRGMASRLYAEMRERGRTFWHVVYAPYITHDVTRDDVREVVRLALVDAHGHYTAVAKIFNLERADYKRLMNFLRKHECLLDYRAFRNLPSEGNAPHSAVGRSSI